MKRKILFSVVVWGMLFGILEIVVRVHHAATGSGSERARASTFVPNPFLVYAGNPEHTSHGPQGFRGDAVYSPDHEAFRIVCLGGSSTYGTEVESGDSYPVRLEDELRARVGDGVEVVNAGLAAYSTPNLISQLSLRAAHLDPQLALFYVGYNDIANRILYEDFETDYSHAQKPWQMPEMPFWQHSLLLDRIGTRLGIASRRNPHFQKVTFRPHAGDPHENWEGSSSQAFRRNLKSLVGIARAHGITPVFVTQATDFENHPMQGSYAGLNELWTGAVEEYTEILREVSESLGVALVEVREPMTNRAEFFADSIHMNAAGNAERARLIAASLDAQGLLPDAGAPEPTLRISASQ